MKSLTVTVSGEARTRALHVTAQVL